MNVASKRRKSIVGLIIGIFLVVAGYLIMDRLAGHFLGIKKMVQHGVVYVYADNSYQWCTWLTVLGALFVTFGLKNISNFLAGWSTSPYDSYQTLKRCKLALFAFFAVCLNAFSLDFFADISRYSFKGTDLGEEMIVFEQYNLYMAFGFGLALLVIILINSCSKGYITYFYYPLCIIAIAESVFGIVFQTTGVVWIWVVYATGLIVAGMWLATRTSRTQPGIGFGKKPERISENIAFFASSHGLGHIMRLTPVIEYILKTTDCHIVLVCDDDKLNFAKGYFYTQTGIPEEYLREHLETVAIKTDFGLAVKDGSLKIDVDKVNEGVIKYISDFPTLAYAGVEIIDDYQITKVVSDIAPFAFASAAFREIPSILMLSFTWIEIYQEYLSEALIKPYREMYSRANKVLRYALCNRISRASFPEATDVGFVCRPINYEHAAEIKAQYENPIVFCTIGLSNNGIAFNPDVSALPYTFIVTKGVNFVGDNVVELGSNQYDAQDYVAASKFCIIKSGWTTISECMIAGKPMALLGRDDVAEDRMSIDMLTEARRGIKVSVEELNDLASVLEKMENTDFDTTPMNNDFAHIAEEILEYH